MAPHAVVEYITSAIFAAEARVGLLSNMFETARQLDAWLFLVGNRGLDFPGADFAMVVLSDRRLGLWLSAVLILLFLWRDGRRVVVPIGLTIVAVLTANFAADWIKVAMQRTRPCHVIQGIRLLAGCTGSFSFPSNHASNLFALTMVAWASHLPWRWPALVIAIGGGLSRVYLGVHYPADVLAGAALGTTVACAMVAVSRSVRSRFASLPAGIQSAKKDMAAVSFRPS